MTLTFPLKAAACSSMCHIIIFFSKFWICYPCLFLHVWTKFVFHCKLWVAELCNGKGTLFMADWIIQVKRQFSVWLSTWNHPANTVPSASLYETEDLRGQQKTGNLGKKQSLLSDGWHLVTQRNNTLSGKGLPNKGNGLFQLAFIKRHCWNGRYLSISVYPLEIYPRQQVSLMLIMSFPFVAQCKLLTPTILTQHFQNYSRPINFF